MARKATVNLERDTTTTRVYTDSLRILKILAEIQGMGLADYVDVLARDAAKRDGGKLMEAFAQYRDGEGGGRGAKRPPNLDSAKK